MLSREKFKNLFPPLGVRVWRLLWGHTLSLVGSGLRLPFLVVYLHEIRGINIVTASVILAVNTAAGLLALPIGGLVDQFGAGLLAVICLLISAVGTMGFIFVHEPILAFVAAILLGFGNAGWWTALSSTFAAAVPTNQRGAVFGVHYALQNVGIGLGGFLGAFLVNVNSPSSFYTLFIGDGATFILFAILLIGFGEVRRPSVTTLSPSVEQPQVEQAPAAAKKRSSGYRQVLKDHVLLAATLLNTVIMIAALGQIYVTFPAWIIGSVHSTARVVGLAFSANTLTIILIQLFVIQLLRGKRRTRAAALACIFFALAWGLTLTAGIAHGTVIAIFLVVIALAIFAVGETFLSPSLAGLINDAAPPELRGRYNAVYNLSGIIGPIIAPVVAGIFLEFNLGATLLVVLVIACGLAALLALWIERYVPVATNRGSISDAAEQELVSQVESPSATL